MVDVDIDDEIRIHADGAILTIMASDVIECIRREQGLPVLRPISGEKQCPNPECDGGWAPDRLKNGWWVCPMCRKTWR